MKRMYFPLMLGIVLAMLFAGCQNRPGILGPVSTERLNPGQPGDIALVADSAFLWVFVTQAGGQNVNIHRITGSWTETGVTWNSFAESFDPTVWGSFTPTTIGWYRTQITGLVQGWLDGTYPNYGLLLDQVSGDFSAYASSETTETALRPKLELCFTENGVPDCITIQRGDPDEVLDSFVHQLFPDDNFGTRTFLLAGFAGEFEKQAMIRFRFPETPPELAAIGNFVWYDTNMNGIQDDGESGVPDVTVHLYNCADNLVGTDVTDDGGLYLFGDLNPGDYYVHFVLPDGYQFSPQDQGSDNTVDSDADVNTGRTICTHLDSAETDLTWDAGMFRSPVEGCTRTIGYWKNHAGFGPQDDEVTPLLPIWLGLSDSTKSIHVTTARIAVDILSQRVYGVPSNGITKLYAQLLAAKLNIASGADGGDVATVIADADAFLAAYDWHDWSSLTQEQKQMVLRWHGTLDNYNEGFIGPGHCNED